LLNDAHPIPVYTNVYEPLCSVKRSVYTVSDYTLRQSSGTARIAKPDNVRDYKFQAVDEKRTIDRLALAEPSPLPSRLDRSPSPPDPLQLLETPPVRDRHCPNNCCNCSATRGENDATGAPPPPNLQKINGTYRNVTTVPHEGAILFLQYSLSPLFCPLAGTIVFRSLPRILLKLNALTRVLTSAGTSRRWPESGNPRSPFPFRPCSSVYSNGTM